MATTTMLNLPVATGLAGDESFWVVQGGTDKRITAQAMTVNAGRTRLTADTTWYVRTDGSDSNTGLADTAAGAFATVQHGIDVIQDTIDANGHGVTLHLGTGNWTGGPYVINYVLGTDYRAFIIKGAGSANTRVSLWAGAFPGFILRSITIDAAMGDGSTGLLIGEFCEVVVDDSDVVFATNGFTDIYAYDHGSFSYNASYSISGNKSSHFTGDFYARYHNLLGAANNITMVGNPAITAFFALRDHMQVDFESGTSSGASTGSKYTITGLSPGITGTVANIPGSTPGTFVADPVDVLNLAANAAVTNATFKSVRGTPVVFASLPATPVEGMLVPVTDSNTAVWGAVMAGLGANHVLAYYNGTNWTVAAK